MWSYANHIHGLLSARLKHEPDKHTLKVIAIAIVAVVIVAAVGDVVSPSVVVVVIVFVFVVAVLLDGQKSRFGVGHTTHALAS